MCCLLNFFHMRIAICVESEYYLSTQFYKCTVSFSLEIIRSINLDFSIAPDNGQISITHYFILILIYSFLIRNHLSCSTKINSLSSTYTHQRAASWTRLTQQVSSVRQKTPLTMNDFAWKLLTQTLLLWHHKLRPSRMSTLWRKVVILTHFLTMKKVPVHCCFDVFCG